MPSSKPTRARAFGLRIVSCSEERWEYFASQTDLANRLARLLKRFNRSLMNAGHYNEDVPHERIDDAGHCLRLQKETRYQASHSHYGATWKVRVDWKTFDVFGAQGNPLAIVKLLQLAHVKSSKFQGRGASIPHGVRGKGAVPFIHKLRGGTGCFRTIRSSGDIRLHGFIQSQEGEPKVRAARASNNLPTAWDDHIRNVQKSWKQQRKAPKQWDR